MSSYFYYQCDQCGTIYYTANIEDICDAQGEFGLECRKCIELNNSIAWEVMWTSDLEVI